MPARRVRTAKRRRRRSVAGMWEQEKLQAMTNSAKPLPPPTLDDFRKVFREYRRVFGRYPNLLRPRRFSEKIQWRKLFDLNSLYSTMADKIAARDFIAERVGPEWLVPLLWTGESVDDIPFDALEPPYVLKCSHGSTFNVIVRDRASLDREKIRATLQDRLARNFGAYMREPCYTPIQPRLLAEQLMLEADGSPPLELKIFVFDGRARLIHGVFVDKTRARFDAMHDCDWRPLPWHAFNQRYEGQVPKPARLAEFVSLAERLGAGFEHLRVDLYQWQGQPRVGELTLYNLSGLWPFTPDEVDFILGGWWRLRRPIGRALAAVLLH